MDQLEKNRHIVVSALRGERVGLSQSGLGTATDYSHLQDKYLRSKLPASTYPTGGAVVAAGLAVAVAAGWLGTVVAGGAAVGSSPAATGNQHHSGDG